MEHFSHIVKKVKFIRILLEVANYFLQLVRKNDTFFALCQKSATFFASYQKMKDFPHVLERKE